MSPALTRQLLVGLFLVFCFGFFHQLPIWNENSRYDLVSAIVDHHTAQIDRTQGNTGDKAFYNGHYYSDKAPGAALLGVPVYAAMRLVRIVSRQPAPDSGEAIQVLAFVVCGIPTALLAVLLIRFLLPIVGEWWATVVTLGYALGTIAFPFATMYFGHAATTFFLFATFYLLHQPEGPGRPWRPAFAGVCAGLAVLVDVSAGIAVIALGIYACRHSFRRPVLPTLRTPVLFVAGAVPLAVVFLAYNWASFGGPLSLGYLHEANGSFATAQRQGILGVTWPRLGAIRDLLFSTRGLLRFSPWLVLAPAGILAARPRGLRFEIGLCAALVSAYLLVNSGYYLPFGGATPGPRYLVPMLPFAAVLVALAPRLVRYLAAAFIVPSIALMTLATATMPNAFEDVSDPFNDLWVPMFRARFLVETTGWVRWGLHGLLPLAALGLGAVCVALAVWATTDRSTTVRRVGVCAAVVFGAIFVSLGTPIDVPSALGLTALVQRVGIGQGGVGVTILDTGVASIRTTDRLNSVRPWAQIEGREAGAPNTRVVYTIFNSRGQSVFGVSYDRLAWAGSQRRILPVEWSTAGVAPGVYSVTVTVMSEDHRTVYATVPDGARFTIPAAA